jgi:hypothetical protein
LRVPFKGDSFKRKMQRVSFAERFGGKRVLNIKGLNDLKALNSQRSRPPEKLDEKKLE